MSVDDCPELKEVRDFIVNFIAKYLEKHPNSQISQLTIIVDSDGSVDAVSDNPGFETELINSLSCDICELLFNLALTCPYDVVTLLTSPTVIVKFL